MSTCDLASKLFPLTDATVSILGMGWANERGRYYVTPPLIGGAHTQNDPWNWFVCFTCIYLTCQNRYHAEFQAKYKEVIINCWVICYKYKFRETYSMKTFNFISKFYVVGMHYFVYWRPRLMTQMSVTSLHWHRYITKHFHQNPDPTIYYRYSDNAILKYILKNQTLLTFYDYHSLFLVGKPHIQTLINPRKIHC